MLSCCSCVKYTLELRGRSQNQVCPKPGVLIVILLEKTPALSYLVKHFIKKILLLVSEVVKVNLAAGG